MNTKKATKKPAGSKRALAAVRGITQPTMEDLMEAICDMLKAKYDARLSPGVLFSHINNPDGKGELWYVSLQHFPHGERTILYFCKKDTLIEAVRDAATWLLADKVEKAKERLRKALG